MAGLKEKVIKGTMWVLLEKFSKMFVGFAVTLVLARLLTPADYGTVALLTIFIQLAGVFADVGLGGALVQKKEATDLDFNSVFYLSLALSIVFYWVLFLIAPFVAEFYKMPELVAILRVMSVTIVLNTIVSIQSAELQRKLWFDRSFKIGLIGTLSTACIGITMAFLGYGSWAIVWSTVGGAAVSVVTYSIFIAWRPRLMFSWEAVYSLFQFGWKMVGVSLVNRTYENLYGVLIGKFYTPADLALVNKGRSLASLLMDSVDGTINGVAYPAMAQIQDQIDKVREGMRKMLTCSTFLVFPLMTGLSICADPVVFLFFGENWLPCVPYVRIACFMYAVYPFHTINLFTLLALGHSDIFLKLEIVKKVVGLVIILLAIKHGVFMFMLVTTLIFDPFSVIVNTRPVKRIIGYSLRMQLKDILPSVCGCVVMGLLVYGFGVLATFFVCGKGHTVFVDLMVLIIQILVGMISYAVMSYWMKIPALKEYVQILKPRLGRRFPVFFNRISSRYGVG